MSSPRIFETLKNALLASGLDVIDIGLVPTMGALHATVHAALAVPTDFVDRPLPRPAGIGTGGAPGMGIMG